MNGDWREHIIHLIENLEKKYERNDRQTQRLLQQILVDISTLKVKSGIWGMLGGTAMILLMYLVKELG